MSVPIFFLKSSILLGLFIIGFKIGYFFLNCQKKKEREWNTALKNVIYLCKLIKNVYFCNSLITVLIKIMINRVLIRLKIIQIVYAYYQNGSKNLDSAEKELFFSLSKAYDLYNYLLMLMIALTEYAQKRIDTAKAKLAPTKEELYPNMKFVENKFVAQLEVNKQLSEFIANQKRTWANDQDFIKELYEKIIASDIYKEYMASSDKSYEADRELWRKLYKTFVFNNDSLDLGVGRSEFILEWW